MTDEIGWASLGIKPELDRGFDTTLSRKLDPALGRVGSSSGRKFGAILGKAAVAGAAGVIAAGFAAFKLGQSAVAEARESQKVAALTASTIKATGGAAGITAKQVDKLSFAIGKKAAVDDETIASGLNMLLTFKEIRNETGKGGRIFNRAAKDVTDYAAAVAAASGGQIDLKSASIQVGKALNDPLKGITALGKAGVTFTDQQKEQIAAFVEAGDKASAQKIILRELESEFRGAAESQATMGDRVAFAWGNIQEKLGTVLLPMLNTLEKAFLKKGVPAIEGWVDVFEKKGIPALKHFYEKAKPVAQDVLPVLADTLGTVRDVLSDAAPYALDLVNAFRDMPDWAKKAIVAGGLTVWAGSKVPGANLLPKTAGGLFGLVTKAKPLPVFVVNNGIGGTGVGTKGPSAKAVGAGALTVASRAVPYTLPLILGGDSAPENLTKPQAKVKEAWLALYKITRTESGDALNNALLAATNQQLRIWRKAFKAETGLSFPEFGRLAEAGSKTGYQFPDNLTRGNNNGLEGLLLGPLAGAQAKVDKLGETKVEPRFRFRGVTEALAQIESLRRKAETPMHARLVLDALDEGLTDLGLGAIVPNRANQRRGRGGVNVNIGTVQAHDYRDFMGNMQERSQLAQLDGIAR